MFATTQLRTFAAFLMAVLSLGTAATACAQVTSYGQLDLSVVDQNGQTLNAVVITVQQNGKTVLQERVPPSGRMLRHLTPGTYKVLVQRQGFYTATLDNLTLVAGGAMPVEVRLQPVREYREELEVTAQSSPIDPEQSASSHSLTAEDIATIPYPSTRDYRNVLPFVPGVIADNSGQIHVAGAGTQQVQDYLDGFEVAQPASGALSLRVNPDALRKIDVRSSRYSAQFGKGSGGAVDLEVQDGDNRLRYNATDFVPTFQMVKGFHLNNWTPRAYVSGPLIKDKVWFDVAHSGENDLTIIEQLPDGQDMTRSWRTDDMVRLRFNLTPGNVMTASTLMSFAGITNSGLTPHDPISVAVDSHSFLTLYTLKDQITIARNTLLELGAGFHDSEGNFTPHGFGTYQFLPTGRAGSFYLHSDTASSRSQTFTNLYLAPWHRWGRHQITVGGRVDRVLYDGATLRTIIDVEDGTGALLRQITFANPPHFSVHTVESSAYAQDRWSGFDRVTVETGVRWDRDSFLGQDVFSPRIAGTALLSRSSETKVSAGIGIYYDRTNLAEVAQSLQGSRVDQYFSPAPLTIPGTFIADPRLLTLPRFVNWSVGLERRLPGRVYVRLDYLSRHGNNVWAYEPQANGTFLLGDRRDDKYDAAQITVRRDFKPGYPMMFSYTRSNARSNESVDFGIDNFTTGTQVGGPLPWDSPNQITSWGSLPLPSWWKFRKFDFAYSLLWRTGFPFATLNNFQQIVSPPGTFRLPNFFTLNPAIEKKFTFHGYRWAARAGIENVTNSPNPPFVDSNVNSPTFLTFFGQGHRTFNGRIRFLGKKQQ